MFWWLVSIINASITSIFMYSYVDDRDPFSASALAFFLLMFVICIIEYVKSDS